MTSAKIWEFGPPPLVISKSTQPPFLSSEFGQTPLISLLVSFMDGNAVTFRMQTNDENCRDLYPSVLSFPLPFPIFKVKSVVPLTAGSRRRDHDETSLVLLFYDDDEAQGRR